MRGADGNEQVLVRLVDGPYPTNALVVPLSPDGFEWPLPERVVVLGLSGKAMALANIEKLEADGHDVSKMVTYRKVSESQLPPDTGQLAHVARGAQYELDHDGMAS